MKDNLNQVVEYTIEAPGECNVLRRATVTHYSEDGTVVYLHEDPGEGKTAIARQLPVGQFWVRKIIETLPAPDQLVAAGLAAAPPPPPSPEVDPSMGRRLSPLRTQPETRRSMAQAKSFKPIPGAAGPDEFADPV
jgi:hypothetical protein